jgi:hypothetical protein
MFYSALSSWVLPQPPPRAMVESVDMPRRIWRFIRSAPLTYLWLIILAYTTTVAYDVNRQRLHHILVHRSTNLRHLDTDPIKVLIESLLWIDGRSWLPYYLLVFTIFLAPAERWLGSLRWLLVGLAAHVGATYLSEGWLYWQIVRGAAPQSMENVRDIGVSYFAVGLVAVLSYHIARPWRWGYVAAVLLTFIVWLVWHPGLTALGHGCAVLVGLCCYPLTRGRGAPWHPRSVRALFRCPDAADRTAA